MKRKKLKSFVLGLLCLTLLIVGLSGKALPYFGDECGEEVPVSPQSLIKRIRNAIVLQEKIKIVRQLNELLHDGWLFGLESEIAKELLPLWDQPLDSRLAVEVLSFFMGTGETLRLEDPLMFKRIFFEVPLKKLSGSPSDFQMALMALKVYVSYNPGTREIVVLWRKLSNFLSKSEFSGEVMEIYREISLRPRTSSVLTFHDLKMLMDRSSKDFLWEIPEIFENIGSFAAKKALLAFAQREDFPLHYREEALRKLASSLGNEDRELLPSITEIFLTEEAPERLVEAAAEVILRMEWTPSVVLKKDLKVLSLHLKSSYEKIARAAIRFLESMGRDGIKLLMKEWCEGNIKTIPDYDYEVMEVLKGKAHLIREEIRRCWKKRSDENLLALAAASGDVEVLLEAVNLPSYSRSNLVNYLAPYFNRQKVREKLREVLHPAEYKRVEYLYLLKKFPDKAWRKILSDLRIDRSMTALEAVRYLNVAYPGKVVKALLDIGLNDPSDLRRSRALRMISEAPNGREIICRNTGFLVKTLNDVSELVRREASYLFVICPAKDPSIHKILLKLLYDPNRYVRHNAAMALSVAENLSEQALYELEKKLLSGDKDLNVVNAAKKAYVKALLDSEKGVRKLVKILFKEKKLRDDLWPYMMDAGKMRDKLVEKFLKEVGTYPAKTWLPPVEPSIMRVFENSKHVWTIIEKVVPTEILSGWLIKQAVLRKDLSPREKLLMLDLSTISILKKSKEALDVWMEGVHLKEDPLILRSILKKLGFHALKRLIDSLWEKPDKLYDAWKHLMEGSAYEGSFSLDGVSSLAHIEWVEKRLAEISPGSNDPRLKVLAFIINSMLQNLKETELRTLSRRELFGLLARHMKYKGECAVVSPLLASLRKSQAFPKKIWK